jgi:hypothetical protein
MIHSVKNGNICKERLRDLWTIIAKRKVKSPRQVHA